MTSIGASAAPADLDAATCSHGAPSARNLIVTAFGDIVLPAGVDAEVTVQSLTRLLNGFGVSERLVRTSLSRIAADGLVAVRSSGRRSFYRVAPDAIELFRTADRRIYAGPPSTWDGAWTVVILDGHEATPERRAHLRQELVWAGLGTVAPNVMASPVVSVDAVTELIRRLGGFEHVLVSSSHLASGPGLIDAVELARRSAELGEVETRYDAFARRFAAFDDAALARLDPDRALKARLLLVSTFRRIALADPQLPAALLPDAWVGDVARAEARRVYRAVAERSDDVVREITGLSVSTRPTRFA